MKVCFDVNTLIYLFAGAPEQADVFFAYDVTNIRKFDACIPACALPTIHYILRRGGLRGEELDGVMQNVFEMFDVFDVIEQDGKSALQNNMDDYEDALIAESAARNGVDLILTYNEKDFVESSVKAMLPAQFIEAFKPASVEYAEMNQGEILKLYGIAKNDELFERPDQGDFSLDDDPSTFFD